MTRLAMVTFAASLLAGCAHDDTAAPSLARRPIEDRGFAEPAAPLPAAVVTDPTLDRIVGDLDRRLAAGVQTFDRDRTAAERLAAVSGARQVGSGTWLDAQGAIATLDSTRADVAALLSEADDLTGKRAAALQPDYPALTALRDRIAAEGDREAEAIGKLQASLPTG